MVKRTECRIEGTTHSYAKSTKVDSSILLHAFEVCLFTLRRRIPEFSASYRDNPTFALPLYPLAHLKYLRVRTVVWHLLRPIPFNAAMHATHQPPWSWLRAPRALEYGRCSTYTPPPLRPPMPAQHRVNMPCRRRSPPSIKYHPRALHEALFLPADTHNTLCFKANPQHFAALRHNTAPRPLISCGPRNGTLQTVQPQGRP